MKKVSILVVLMMIISLICGFQSKAEKAMETRTLFPVTQNGKYGYIDKTGKLVINPQFEGESGQPGYDFSEGLAKIKIGDKYGYIDETGKIVIQAKYDDAEDFSDGLANVKTGGRDGKWGYINKKGKFLIKPEFENFSSFSEGLACVARVRDEKLWQPFIDKTGKIVIDNPDFYDCTNFSDGVALVRILIKNPDGITKSMIWCYIDKNGSILIRNPDLTWASSFKNGLAAVQIKRIKNKYGYIDKSGNVVIEPQFDVAFDFSEGLASVSFDLKDGYGYIDKTGKLVINPQFNVAEEFLGGLARVTVETKYGYIDKSGKYIWEPTK